MRNGSVGKPPLIAEAAASSVLSGRKFYWRGFESDRGSTIRPAGGRGRRGGRGGSSGRDESRPDATSTDPAARDPECSEQRRTQDRISLRGAGIRAARRAAEGDTSLISTLRPLITF
jgi:hypothetical protein